VLLEVEISFFLDRSIGNLQLDVNQSWTLHIRSDKGGNEASAELRAAFVPNNHRNTLILLVLLSIFHAAYQISSSPPLAPEKQLPHSFPRQLQVHSFNTMATNPSATQAPKASGDNAAALANAPVEKEPDSSSKLRTLLSLLRRSVTGSQTASKHTKSS
jgi:hypothetical protein